MTPENIPKNINEFQTQKQKTVSYKEETLPPCWVNTGYNLQRVEKEEPLSIQNSRIIQTESKGILRSKITRLIESAQETICVSSFLIADSYIIPALLAAAERGVRVYLLTASETQLLKDSEDDKEFEVERMREHIKTLEKMAGLILVRTGLNLHSKFVLIDPTTQHPRGFLLTANITSDALTRNVELGVNLYPREVKDLFNQFLIGFWKESESELIEPGSITKNKQWTPGPISEPQETLFTLSSKSTIKQKIRDLIIQAQNEIIVSTYGIELSNEITQELLKSLNSGKKIKILARPRQNKQTMDALIALSNAGAEIRGHPWLHAKAVLVNNPDGWTGIVMTANIEKHGLEEGFETGIKLEKEDAEKLRQILDNWWNHFPQKLLVKPKLGEITGDAHLWINDKYQKISIEPELNENLGIQIVNTFNDLETHEPKITSKQKDSAKYHSITYSWMNIPPQLPLTAKKESTQEDLDIYKDKNSTYLVVTNKTQLAKALEIAPKMKAKIVTR